MDASLHMTRVACPCQAGSKLLPQVEEVEYLQVLFVRQRRKEQVRCMLQCSVMVKRELNVKAKLLNYLWITYGHEL